MKIFAATGGENLGTIGGEGLGPFGNLGKGAGGATAGLSGIAAAISGVIGIMTIAAGIWFLFQFMTGALGWLSSGGDKAKLEGARQRITNALIGLVIVVAGWSILAIASQFFGVDFLLENPATLINQLKL
jgi:hypothetical protein